MDESVDSAPPDVDPSDVEGSIGPEVDESDSRLDVDKSVVDPPDVDPPDVDPPDVDPSDVDGSVGPEVVASTGEVELSG